jgi:hypothetical protein
MGDVNLSRLFIFCLALANIHERSLYEWMILAK